jgi:hypothetical protein
VSENATNQNGIGCVLGLQCSDLETVKRGYELRCDLSRLFLGHRLWMSRWFRFEYVLQCSAVFGCAPVAEEFSRKGGSGQENQVAITVESGRRLMRGKIKGGANLHYLEVKPSQSSR